MDPAKDAISKGDSPRPELAIPDGSDGRASPPPAHRQVLTPNAGSLRISGLALRKEPEPSAQNDDSDSQTENTDEGGPKERRHGAEEDEDASPGDAPSDASSGAGDGSASDGDDSDDSDEDEDSDSDSGEDDSDEASDDSDEEDSDEDSDEETPAPRVPAKKIGRIRPQTTKPVVPALNSTANKPAVPTVGGMKLALPKPALPTLHKVSLPLPLGQLATPSQQTQSNGSPPVTPVPYDYSSVADISIDLERLIADRFERERFQEKFEKKNPEVLKFLSLPETLRTLINFTTRNFEPSKGDSQSELTPAQRTVIIDSCANFAVYLLTSSACTRLQACLLRRHELLDDLTSVLIRPTRKTLPTGEWGKLVSSLATQKSGEELKKYFVDSARKDLSRNIVQLLVDNLDSAHVAKMLIEILTPDKLRIPWTDFFAEAPFDFAAALFKRFSAISDLRADEFPYILYVELQHIADLVTAILDKVATSNLGKTISSTAGFVSILVTSIHRSRVSFAESLKTAPASPLKPLIHPSLPHAITILGQIVRHQVNGGRYNELCPPALEALVSGGESDFFLDLAELLKDANGVDGKLLRFGLFRNQLLELIEGLYSSGYQTIHERLFGAKIFGVLFDVFMSRAMNTILHQKAANIIRDVLQCNSKELLVDFVKECGLVDKLVNAFDRYETIMPNLREFNALDIYPHLFQVVLRLDLVAKMAPRYQLLADFLGSHEGWKRFVGSNTYKNYDEALKKKLLKEQGAFYIRKKPNVRR